MPKSVAELQRAVRHQEAVELTLAWVKEMRERLPELEAALQRGTVPGISPALDLRQIHEALNALFSFHPSEARFYKPTAAELKAELASRVWWE